MSQIFRDNREDSRVALDGLHARLNAAEEIITKARLALLIPAVSLGNISLSFYDIFDVINHCLPEPEPAPAPKSERFRDSL